MPDGLKPTNPKDIIGTTKLPLGLFPTTAIAGGSLAFLEGALKYGRTNWRAGGVLASVYRDALLRHLTSWWEGEDIDPESGLSHLYKAIACVAILIDAEASGVLRDDRAYPGGYADLEKRLTPLIAPLAERFKDKDPHHFTIQDTK